MLYYDHAWGTTHDFFYFFPPVPAYSVFYISNLSISYESCDFMININTEGREHF